MAALNDPLRENKKLPPPSINLQCEAVKFGYRNSDHEIPETIAQDKEKERKNIKEAIKKITKKEQKG